MTTQEIYSNWIKTSGREDDLLYEQYEAGKMNYVDYKIAEAKVHMRTYRELAESLKGRTDEAAQKIQRSVEPYIAHQRERIEYYRKLGAGELVDDQEDDD